MAAIIFFFCLTAASYTKLAAQEQVLNQLPCYTNFIHYPNRALFSSKISTVQLAEVGECVLHCAKEKFCKSINFAIESEAATKTHRCELMKEDKYSKIEKFAVSSEFDHYGPKSPCESLPCLNGGSCVTNYVNNTFSCDCQTGYQGKHCQTDIDECSSKPCQNGGICSNLVGGYRCTCAVGFRGKNCTVFSVTPRCWRMNSSPSSGWSQSTSNTPDAIDFSVNVDCYLRGYLLWGPSSGSGSYTVRMEVYDDQRARLMLTNHSVSTSTTTYEVLFSTPVLIRANRWYSAVAHIVGPLAHRGIGGQSTISCNGWTVRFRSSGRSKNGSNQSYGQIPALLLP